MVKIGRAKVPEWRLRTLQASSPVRLHVLALAPGSELERIWHVQFHKLRRHAEWFDPAVADYFREHGAPDECVRCRIYGDARDRPTRGRVAGAAPTARVR